MTDPIRILFLSADPYADLKNLDTEFRRIREALPDHDRFHVISKSHVFAADLQKLLQEVKPHILHFAGHGTERGNLVTHSHDPREAEQIMPVDGLAESLHALRDKVPTRIVVLNACWSLECAEKLRQEVDAVVGMTDAIYTNSAVAFAEGFYQALGEGAHVVNAVELGRAQIKTLNMFGEDVPEPLIRYGIDPQSIAVRDAELASEELPPRWGDDPEPETRHTPPPLTPEIIKTLLERFPRERGTIHIPDESRRISARLSGAVVYRVTIQREGRSTSAFAKFDVFAKVSRECIVHKAVKKSAIAPFVPE